jgi:hypothetical protein
MNKMESIMTVTTLANGSELVRLVAQEVLGNEVADTFNGSELTRSVLYDLSQTKFQEALARRLGN